MDRSKMVLVFDGLEDLKEYYGKEILITINVPTNKDHKNKYTLQGFKYHSAEYTILKPMPEKKEIGNYNDYPSGFNNGYNKCIDELLGENTTRDCKTCGHSNDGKCAGTEECHECMWVNNYIEEDTGDTDND